jgi:hypothetical protein
VAGEEPRCFSGASRLGRVEAGARPLPSHLNCDSQVSRSFSDRVRPSNQVDGTDAGSGIRGTPGVFNCPASQGKDDANASVAKGQSCLPAVETIPQSMPFAFPRAHSVLAASV